MTEKQTFNTSKSDNFLDIVLSNNCMGAVFGRHGIGKTAILVQLALMAVSKRINVLHVSLREPVDKVNLWYREVMDRLEKRFGRDNRLITPWDNVQAHRLIMVFPPDDFSVSTMEQRLKSLKEENVFQPGMMVIDGFSFEHGGILPEAFKELAEKQSLQIWFSLCAHRHEINESKGLPASLKPCEAAFEKFIRLQPVEKKVQLNILESGKEESGHSDIFLDPSSLLMVKEESNGL